MTEYELDKIKKSFVRSNAKCPVEVACLLTVIKYYNGKETDIHTLTEWCKINGKLTLAGMKQGAIYSGMKAELNTVKRLWMYNTIPKSINTK